MRGKSAYGTTALSVKYNDMKIIFDNLKAQINLETSQEAEIFNKLCNKFSILAPGALYMRSYHTWKKTKGKIGWDGRVKLLGTNILTGLVPYVQHELGKEGVNPQLVDNRPPQIIASKLNKPTVELREYQKEAIKSALGIPANADLWWPRGILEVATGGGKTEIAVAMYQILPIPTLFLVHRKHLLKQVKDRFSKYGISSGQIGDGINEVHPSLNVATIQTLESKLKRKEPMGWLNDVQQVFFDEAHSIAASIAKGNTFVNIANLLPNAYMRWGLTATPFMRDQYSNWLLKGVTGEVLYSISNETLINQGYLTPPEIVMVEVPKIESCPVSWPECYNTGVVLNSNRTKIIINYLKELPKPCLVLCTQVAHAEILNLNAGLAGLNAPVLSGEDSSETRAKVIQDLRTGKLDQVICTSIFNEGVDIPELRSLILAAGGKSKVNQLQKIGRGLRRAEEKDKVIVVDFIDTSSKILLRHSKERQKIWTEQGFKIFTK